MKKKKKIHSPARAPTIVKLSATNPTAPKIAMPNTVPAFLESEVWDVAFEWLNDWWKTHFTRMRERSSEKSIKFSWVGLYVFVSRIFWQRRTSDVTSLSYSKPTSRLFSFAIFDFSLCLITKKFSSLARGLSSNLIVEIPTAKSLR